MDAKSSLSLVACGRLRRLLCTVPAGAILYIPCPLRQLCRPPPPTAAVCAAKCGPAGGLEDALPVVGTGAEVNMFSIHYSSKLSPHMRMDLTAGSLIPDDLS